MKRVSQGLSVQALGEDDGIRLAFTEVSLNDRCGADRSINDGATDVHRTRAI